MGLQDKLLQDMNSALKSGNREVLETLRMIRAQIQNAAIERSGKLDEADIVGVLSKEAKKRKEAIEMYEKGGRDDLARKESHELKIISGYLPKTLTEDEIQVLVKEAIDQTDAGGLHDMGKVMGHIMPRVKGRADGRVIQEHVRKLLS
ncbi:MAG TPA: GatB/YqeY domain-containing protein [bacterium]|nr:GatB/YqeY domain-containing protein [bacterium]